MTDKQAIIRRRQQEKAEKMRKRRLAGKRNTLDRQWCRQDKYYVDDSTLYYEPDETVEIITIRNALNGFNKFGHPGEIDTEPLLKFIGSKRYIGNFGEGWLFRFMFHEIIVYRPDIIEMIAKTGINLNKKYKGRTILEVMLVLMKVNHSMGYTFESIKILIKHGADPYPYSFLHAACEAWVSSELKYNMIKYFVDIGMDVDRIDSYFDPIDLYLFEFEYRYYQVDEYAHKSFEYLMEKSDRKIKRYWHHRIKSLPNRYIHRKFELFQVCNFNTGNKLIGDVKWIISSYLR